VKLVCIYIFSINFVAFLKMFHHSYPVQLMHIVKISDVIFSPTV